ncbi:3-deoxy-manno-octulosonate cytidylyltransferase [Algivirga pacifica]|uniref:3-deoxy-manno-octulosonate cytidylyltransferase n=1 Tax=Algivirga pacifica TaxID=1162670 RepID=A0ABP9DMC7_9BACT
MMIIGIIPARYASSRFPAKPLADMMGKSMIQRTYEQAKKALSLDKVVVATDHEKIYNHVKAFGGDAVLTSEFHLSGTDRCHEALQLQGEESFDYVINIQGDEPFIDPGQIDMLAGLIQTQGTDIATLGIQIQENGKLFDPNIVKLIKNKEGNAIYFSRQAIPYLRDYPQDVWLDHHDFYKHIGIYAYKAEALGEITKLKPSPLEQMEKLEQLRWLENGYTIKVGVTDKESIGIDTPLDLENALKLLINE